MDKEDAEFILNTIKGLSVDEKFKRLTELFEVVPRNTNNRREKNKEVGK